MTKKSIIVFEKWEDPFETIMDQGKAEEIMDNFDDLDIDNLTDEEIDMLEDQPMRSGRILSAPIKAIHTPFGVYPLSDRILASKNFDIWIAHTRFKLTDDYAPIIMDAEGVEYFEPLTPYRFKFSAAKLFEPAEVKQNIINAVTSYYESTRK